MGFIPWLRECSGTGFFCRCDSVALKQLTRSKHGLCQAHTPQRLENSPAGVTPCSIYWSTHLCKHQSISIRLKSAMNAQTPQGWIVGASVIHATRCSVRLAVSSSNLGFEALSWTARPHVPRLRAFGRSLPQSVTIPSLSTCTLCLSLIASAVLIT